MCHQQMLSGILTMLPSWGAAGHAGHARRRRERLRAGEGAQQQHSNISVLCIKIFYKMYFYDSMCISDCMLQIVYSGLYSSICHLKQIFAIRTGQSSCR